MGMLQSLVAPRVPGRLLLGLRWVADSLDLFPGGDDASRCGWPRSSPEDLQEKVRQLALGLHEVIECPVCFGTMDSTLKQCVNGHGICRTCARKIDKCPTCQQELALALRQNTLLGKILDQLPKLCPYADKGCGTVVFDQEHKTFCEYRPSECKTKLCEWKGCVKDLLDHVRNCKKSFTVSEAILNTEILRSYTFDSNETDSFFTPIIYQNQVFWKYFRRNKVSKGMIIYHKLYHVPTSKQTCNYFMVTSFKKGDIEFKHTCKASIDTDCNEDDVAQCGVIIPDPELEYLKRSGSDFSYEYTFKLVKENIP